jgi:hypothetical protein
LADQGAILDDDSRMMSLVNKKEFHVLVNPHYGADRKKIVNPPLLMGIHFMNDLSVYLLMMAIFLFTIF